MEAHSGESESPGHDGGSGRDRSSGGRPSPRGHLGRAGSTSVGRASLTGVACLVAAAALADEPRFRVELALGGAQSFDSSLHVEQSGQPALDVDADWDTRPFEAPLYYALRISRTGHRGGWALHLAHHKLHLQNPPPEIQRFSISHGYNLLTFERGFVVSGFELWGGAGVVIAHPESTIRGQAQPEDEGGIGRGYHLTGPTVAVAAARPLWRSGHLALVPELRFTLARANVPVAGGEASAPNFAFHLTLGFELSF